MPERLLSFSRKLMYLVLGILSFYEVGNRKLEYDLGSFPFPASNFRFLLWLGRIYIRITMRNIHINDPGKNVRTHYANCQSGAKYHCTH